MHRSLGGGKSFGNLYYKSNSSDNCADVTIYA